MWEPTCHDQNACQCTDSLQIPRRPQYAFQMILLPHVRMYEGCTLDTNARKSNATRLSSQRSQNASALEGVSVAARELPLRLDKVAQASGSEPGNARRRLHSRSDTGTPCRYKPRIETTADTEFC